MQIGCRIWVCRSVIREVHNKLEKNRRAHLKECFEMLKKQVPAAPDEKKTSNLSILHSAIRYIQVRTKEVIFKIYVRLNRAYTGLKEVVGIIVYHLFDIYFDYK